MKILEVITVEHAELMLEALKYTELSFTEYAIIKEFLKRLKPRKITLDDLKIIIEKEKEIATGEDDER